MKDFRILTLVPVKRNLHPKLQLRCFNTVVSLQSFFQSKMDIFLDYRGPGDAMISDFEGEDRIKNLCDVRQGIVRDYLQDYHTHILMMDADVEVSSKVVMGLMMTSQIGIVAPAVMQEKNPKLWYDTFGFIQKSYNRVKFEAPYFEMDDRIVEMICVGTVYLASADVFRKGAQYIPIKGMVDHYSLCMGARQLGFPVLCNRDIVVMHPCLNDFGERRK